MAKIPENVLDVLGMCRTEGNVLYLPDGQLDRKLYMAVNKVLENMGGKWNRKAKGHVFANGDPAEMLEVVLLTQEVRDLKKEFRAFLTAHDAEVYKLDAGVFHESGTDICTRLVKIRK